MPTIAVVRAVVVATAAAGSPHPDPNHMPKLKPSTLTEAGRVIHPTLFTYGNRNREVKLVAQVTQQINGELRIQT